MRAAQISRYHDERHGTIRNALGKEEAMAPKTTTIKVGREADSGRFCTVEQAKSDPKHTVVETIKVPVKKGK